jgi:hypothetical protein
MAEWHWDNLTEVRFPKGKVTPWEVFDWLAHNGIPIQIENTRNLQVRWTLFKGDPYPVLPSSKRGQLERAIAANTPVQERSFEQIEAAGTALDFKEAVYRLAAAAATQHPKSWFAEWWSRASKQLL